MPTPEQALEAWAPDAADHRSFALEGGERLAAAVVTTPEAVRVLLVSDAGRPLVLHWGVAWQFRHEWDLPPENLRPAGSTAFDARAVRTPFAERDGLMFLELAFRKPADGSAPRGMKFVLYRPEDGVWLRCGGADGYLPLFEGEPDPRVASPKLRDLAEQIVGAEKGAPSWTLMHRFSLCHDLLDGRGTTRTPWRFSSPGCVTAPCASSTGSGAITPSRANSATPRTA